MYWYEIVQNNCDYSVCIKSFNKTRLYNHYGFHLLFSKCTYLWAF